MNRLIVKLVSLLIVIMVIFNSSKVFALRIKIATKVPANFRSARIVKKMATEIREKTRGNVIFKIYYGGIKGTGRDLLLKMRSGEIQGGEFTAGEVVSIARALQLMGIPLTFKDYDEIDYTLEKITPYLNREIEKSGFVVLGWIEMGFAYIMSTEPISSVKDLRDRRVWIPQGDRVSQAFFEAIDVDPIPMSIGNVTLALQTGQIDTVANSFAGAIALQWHTRIKYITDLPLFYVYGLLMITREAYRSIPDEYKKTVRDIVKRYFEELKMDIRKSNHDARIALMKEGIKFVPVPIEDYKELEKVIKEVNQQLVGREIPSEGLIRLEEYLEEFRKRHGHK